MAPKVSIRTLWDVRVPMRDGIKLSTDIYLPPEDIEGPYPAILERTPYDNARDMARAFDLGSTFESIKFFVANGYAYVFQDVRGKCDSEGDWDPLFNEGSDGYDTIEWVAKQSWCNGEIGMMGLSYMGWVQWAAAREKPPHLVTMVPTASVGYIMKEFPYTNGIPLAYLAGLASAFGEPSLLLGSDFGGGLGESVLPPAVKNHG
ncbi:MAG: CocE/NonD family hydrolase [Candidatus Hodarchaeota archaeon]